VTEVAVLFFYSICSLL